MIAAQRTCNLNIQQDTIETCSPVSGAWREYIPSTLGWDVSCDGLIYAPEYADELMEVLTSRQKVRLSYYDLELRIVRSGYAIPTGLQEGADIGSLATYSLSFQGSGKLEKVEWGAPMDMQAYDGYVADRCFLGEKDHHIAEQAGSTLLVKEIVVDTTVRMRLENESNGFCVLRLGETMQEVTSLLTQKDNLRLYQKEVAHADGMEHGKWNILLPKGKYYLIYDGGTESYITTSLLSLPTE